MLWPSALHSSTVVVVVWTQRGGCRRRQHGDMIAQKRREQAGATHAVHPVSNSSASMPLSIQHSKYKMGACPSGLRTDVDSTEVQGLPPFATHIVGMPVLPAAQ